ncbi:hypothetical protein BNJ_00337 [Kaumoebavirus]|uniref:hypothetical protein n=1 Tax=Kaumoebavirus TaxID=1859492 RepID=UPI0009C1E2E2|nr:hypothetical protein BNJ_00337 [Kaumoebavirus]ARA72157.1 hypothetical protein BNJ_00337 [Kaumoebavirus]
MMEGGDLSIYEFQGRDYILFPDTGDVILRILINRNQPLVLDDAYFSSPDVPQFMITRAQLKKFDDFSLAETVLGSDNMSFNLVFTPTQSPMQLTPMMKVTSGFLKVANNFIATYFKDGRKDNYLGDDLYLYLKLKGLDTKENAGGRGWCNVQ